MPGNFGTPELNNVRTVQQAYMQAMSNGYLGQLQAYGVGKGLTQQEAEKLAIDNMGLNIHLQDSELYDYFKKQVDSARNNLEKEAYSNYKAVSTGANNVKKEAPAPVDTREPATGENE